MWPDDEKEDQRFLKINLIEVKITWSQNLVCYFKKQSSTGPTPYGKKRTVWILFGCISFNSTTPWQSNNFGSSEPTLQGISCQGLYSHVFHWKESHLFFNTLPVPPFDLVRQDGAAPPYIWAEAGLSGDRQHKSPRKLLQIMQVLFVIFIKTSYFFH